MKKPKHLLKPKETERYPLGENYPDVYLNRREAQCVKYLLEGKTLKGIASILGLSFRTVEYYMTNVQVRLGCYTRAALINRIKNSDFDKHYAAIQAGLDERNYKALQLLEFLGNASPTQTQIDLVERLLAAAPGFDCEILT